MNPSIYAAVGATTQALPLAAGIAARRRLTDGRRWIMAWSAYSVLGLLTERIAAWYGPNLWFGYIAAPLDASLVLMALSCWQQAPLWRRAMRWAIPVALALHVLSLLFVEHRNDFSIASTPLFALLALSAAAFTLVTQAQRTGDTPLRQDWFWIAGGLAVYDTAYALIGPVSELVRSDLSALRHVYGVFQVVNIVCYTIVAAGMLCPSATTFQPVPAGPA